MKCYLEQEESRADPYDYHGHRLLFGRGSGSSLMLVDEKIKSTDCDSGDRRPNPKRRIGRNNE